MKLLVSKHGKTRLKERLGLAKRAIDRHLKKVVLKGETFFKASNKKNIFYIKYYKALYIFARENMNIILVTVLSENMYQYEISTTNKNKFVNFY